MNKNDLLIFLMISIVISIITYITLENIFISIGVLIVYIVAAFLLFIPILKRHRIYIQKFHECYHFINNFIISLSIKKNIAGAMETTVASMPSEFIDLFNSLENMNDNQKLEYLSTYFIFYDYQLFLQIINLWQEQGGDIIAMSKYLSTEIRNNEEYISISETLAKRKYVEVGILWTLTMAILIFLRFALKDFYSKVKTQLIFMISVIALCLFVLVSILLLIKKGTSIKLKGVKENEKVI